MKVLEAKARLMRERRVFLRLHSTLADHRLDRLISRINWDRFPSWKSGIRGAKRYPF